MPRIHLGASTLSRLQRIVSVAIGTWFVTYATFQVLLRLAYPETQLTLFGDARVYRLASIAWMEGRDPYGDLGLYPFAAPPPTLVFMAPFAVVPESIAIPIFVALSVAAVVFAVHRLQLPMWWVLWPPLVDGVLVGNPDAMLVALLLTRLSSIGALAKIYGVIPVILAARWREAALIGVLLVVSAPFLPWALYIAHWPDLRALQEAAGQNLSAWGTPLLVPAVLALIALGPMRAGWLLVPAIWPNTQFHYHALGMPVASGAILAVGLSIPIPWVAPLAVIVVAAGEVIADVRAREGRSGLRSRWRMAE